MHDALTDLHSYVLALDAERERVKNRLAETDDFSADVQARLALDSRRGEIDEELEALRATIVALRQLADPAGEFL